MPSHQQPRLTKSARLELAAAKKLKKKKKAKKLARLNAEANAEAEAEAAGEDLANRSQSAAPARDELEYDVWHSSDPDADSDSAPLVERNVGDDHNHPIVGDDVNHPPVREDVNHLTVGDDVNHLNVGGDVNHPVSPLVILSSDSEDDVVLDAEAEEPDRDGSSASNAAREARVPSSPAPQPPSPPEQGSVLSSSKATRVPQLSPQQQLLLQQQQLLLQQQQLLSQQQQPSPQIPLVVWIFNRKSTFALLFFQHKHLGKMQCTCGRP